MKGGKSKAETKLSVKKRGAGNEKAGNKPAKKGKLANNPNKPKRPASAFFGAVPQILEKTKDDFFSKIVDILRQDADIFYSRIKEIPCITCPSKPEGCMFVMVKLNQTLLEDIKDDFDFCVKLAKEESVIVLPGVTVGLKNWLRITFAAEPSSLEDGLARVKAFCQRHTKKQ
ncbi:tyrosine transaminase family protein [Actinidia rufa]|uniref:Tyrosine transaminase family protein n=1 Tax=Actinidia rufa TaxID=165716 RepID=A0A7J0D9T4_9ERIC|nr:tyrosine transaminase family protein [Actinidia rufa]